MKYPFVTGMGGSETFLKGTEFVAERLPRYEKWTPDQKRTIREVCGEAMAAAGYGTGL